MKEYAMFACLSGDQLHGGIDMTIANESKTHGHSPIMNQAKLHLALHPSLPSHGGHVWLDLSIYVKECNLCHERTI
jgi:hypothetical protein